MSLKPIEDEHNDYLRTILLEKKLRTRLCYYTEIIFTFIILFCALLEFLIYETPSISVLMGIGSYTTMLLYLMMYFGCVYNCVALLNLHTFVSITIAFCCWVAVLHPMMFEEAAYNATKTNQEIIFKYYCFLIIYGALLTSWAVPSFSRAREIQSVEKSHLDHILKMLIAIKKVAKDIPPEGKKYELKPKDVYSLS